MISVIERSSKRSMRISDAIAGNATSVKLDGHNYIIINNGDSQYTKLTYPSGYVALLNVKSRGIRAVPGEVYVEVVDFSITVTKED